VISTGGCAAAREGCAAGYAPPRFDGGWGALSGYDVTAAELHAASAQLQQIDAEVRVELGRLRTEVEALLDGGWRGAAGAAFRGGWGQWSAGAVDVLDGLAGMGRLLAATAAGYENAEANSVLSGGVLMAGRS
jgi:WXG100 family type VII secretion target